MNGYFTMRTIVQAVKVLGGSTPSTYYLRHVLTRFSCRYTYRAVARCEKYGYLKRGADGRTLTITDLGRGYAG